MSSNNKNEDSEDPNEDLQDLNKDTKDSADELEDDRERLEYAVLAEVENKISLVRPSREKRDEYSSRLANLSKIRDDPQFIRVKHKLDTMFLDDDLKRFG